MTILCWNTAGQRRRGHQNMIQQGLKHAGRLSSCLSMIFRKIGLDYSRSSSSQVRDRPHPATVRAASARSIRTEHFDVPREPHRNEHSDKQIAGIEFEPAPAEAATDWPEFSANGRYQRRPTLLANCVRYLNFSRRLRSPRDHGGEFLIAILRGFLKNHPGSHSGHEHDDTRRKRREALQRRPRA